MFQSIQRGWGFLKQAVSMALNDRDLIKPSIFAFGLNLLVGAFFALPLVAAAIFFGGTESWFGQAAFVVVGGLMLFAQYTVSYIFSGMTVYLVFGYLAEGDGRMDKAWATVRRDVLDIVSLAAASTVVKLIENALRGRRGRRSGLGNLVAGLLDAVWTTATYFVLPAMIIEDLNLPNALRRATYMIKNNLLLVAVSEIGVGAILGGVGFALTALAIAVAVAVVIGLGGLGGAGFVAGLVFGAALVALTLAAITVVSSYINTAYHTCLFIWAREAEKAQQAGQAVHSVPAPAPIAAILGA